MSAPDSTEQPLLVVIDPVARRVDGESVRIARDVLCGGAVAKICLPDGPEDVERALARRGRRRPVVIGDDRALLHAVGLLQQRRELPEVPVALVPVGALPEVSLARTLGVPLGSVAAARAVLDGAERRLDALVDEGGTVVLGGLWIPGSGGLNPADETTETPEGNGPNGSYEPLGTGEAAAPAAAVAGDPAGAPGGPGVAAVTGLAGASDVTGVTVDHQPWWSPAARTARSALALLTGPAARHPCPSAPGCGWRPTGWCSRTWISRSPASRSPRWTVSRRSWCTRTARRPPARPRLPGHRLRPRLPLPRRQRPHGPGPHPHVDGAGGGVAPDPSPRTGRLRRG
ncbi:hypothetical protein ACFQ2B_14730 [Streptomyces stramineus]